MFVAGGWSEFRAPTSEEVAMFHKTVKLTGVGYEPFAMATQKVKGTNYKFLCNATAVTNPPYTFLAKVVIYVDLDNDPVLSSITELD